MLRLHKAPKSDHLKIPFKISIKHEEKGQTIGRNKCKKLTSNMKNSTTKVSLFQGILNLVSSL